MKSKQIKANELRDFILAAYELQQEVASYSVAYKRSSKDTFDNFQTLLKSRTKFLDSYGPGIDAAREIFKRKYLANGAKTTDKRKAAFSQAKNDLDSLSASFTFAVEGLDSISVKENPEEFGRQAAVKLGETIANFFAIDEDNGNPFKALFSDEELSLLRNASIRIKNDINR